MLFKEDDIVSIPPEFILSLAKTHGFIQYGKVDLQVAAAKIIADTVEFRIKQIIQESSKFMYRNARTVNHMSLTSDDIKCALKSLKMQDPPGYSDLCNHRYVCADKLYMGNKVIKRESKLLINRENWGRSTLSDIVFSPMGNIISPIPSLNVQWLSVNGTFPLISSNFGVDATDLLAKRAEESYNLLKNPGNRIKNPPNRMLLRGRNSEMIINRLSNAFTDSLNNPISLDATCKPITSIPRVEHVLEKEHVFFLNCVKNAINRSIDLGVIHSSQYKQLAKVLKILSTSLALDQLMPELCYFFSTQINLHIKNSLPHAISIMLSFAHAIISNPYAHVHFHIHQLLIPILQVAIGKYDFPSILIYQVLRLRKKAADLVGRVVSILKSSRNGLEYIDSQLIILLKEALSTQEISIFTLYGALACLSNMAPISRAILLYPNFNSILSTLIYLSLKTRYSIDFGGNSGDNYENLQLLNTKNIIYNETLQLLLGTIYHSLESDFLNMPDLFFSSSNSGYSPPFYQPNTNQLLEMLDTFKLFMNGLLYDMFTPLLTAIMRKLIHNFRYNSVKSLRAIYLEYEAMDLTTGHYVDLTL